MIIEGFLFIFLVLFGAMEPGAAQITFGCLAASTFVIKTMRRDECVRGITMADTKLALSRKWYSTKWVSWTTLKYFLGLCSFVLLCCSTFFWQDLLVNSPGVRKMFFAIGATCASILLTWNILEDPKKPEKYCVDLPLVLFSLLAAGVPGGSYKIYLVFLALIFGIIKSFLTASLHTEAFILNTVKKEHSGDDAIALALQQAYDSLDKTRFSKILTAPRNREKGYRDIFKKKQSREAAARNINIPPAPKFLGDPDPAPSREVIVTEMKRGSVAKPLMISESDTDSSATQRQSHSSNTSSVHSIRAPDPLALTKFLPNTGRSTNDSSTSSSTSSATTSSRRRRRRLLERLIQACTN